MEQTISELQAQERFLTEEQSMLVKMVEAQRKDMGILMAENRRLTSEATDASSPLASSFFA
ncbi:hypothetical protein KSP40_PGU014731 [Platanthera guangdongensis]|uniref:Uncharacterized protein n=1 Tax=Platanthera guangdongensis TaxID=2320717 RepID=A0ABR2MV80_9ASPA